ncbi:MAG: Flp family type IVb pilin [Methyloceanibacter sp.]
MKALVRRFAADETGATATEYGLVAAGISLAIASVAAQVGTQLVGVLDRVVAALKGT